jgi:AraC family transcriptional regulator
VSREVGPVVRRILAGVVYIEAHLHEAIGLDEIARVAGYSPWHFHRLFAAVTGEAPATYLRRRRLAEAARRLIESRLPIAQIAVDAGFDSQATFTRAFSQRFGVAPGRYRRERRRVASQYYRPIDLATLVHRTERTAMTPKIVSRPAFHVVGLRGRFVPGTASQIPQLWNRFVPLLDSVPDRDRATSYGVMVADKAGERGEPALEYTACVEVPSLANVPDGMVGFTVPANTYAVFTHDGHVSKIGQTCDAIWGQWLPNSNLEPAMAPEFESYDERWNPATGEGPVDIYIPVKPPRD